jgi:hypothetical protein
LCAQYKRKLGNCEQTLLVHKTIYMHTYIRTHAHMNRCARGICIYIYIYIYYIHAPTEMQKAYIYIYTYIYIYIYIYIYMHTGEQVRTSFVMNICIYIYIHTHFWSNINRYKSYLYVHLCCHPRFSWSKAVCVKVVSKKAWAQRPLWNTKSGEKPQTFCKFIVRPVVHQRRETTIHC